MRLDETQVLGTSALSVGDRRLRASKMMTFKLVYELVDEGLVTFSELR